MFFHLSSVYTFSLRDILAEFQGDIEVNFWIHFVMFGQKNKCELPTSLEKKIKVTGSQFLRTQNKTGMQTKAFLSLGWNCVLLTAIPLGLGCHLECTGQKKKKECTGQIIILVTVVKVQFITIMFLHCLQEVLIFLFALISISRMFILWIWVHVAMDLSLTFMSHQSRGYIALWCFLCFRFGALFLVTFHWSD